MKMMQGAFFLPCSKRSRTRLAPTPTNISTKSEPEMLKKGTLASPATARASRVLPVPGGPTNSTPLGIRPPSFWNFCASRRNSMISLSSSLASSTPATSLKVTFFCCMESKRARLLPNDNALLPPDCIWRIMKNHSAPITTNGARVCSQTGQPPLLASLMVMSTPLSRNSLIMSELATGTVTWKPALSFLNFPRTSWPITVTSLTLPLSTSERNAEKLISRSLGAELPALTTCHSRTPASTMTSQNAMVLTVEFTEYSSVTGQTQKPFQTYWMLPLDTGCTNSGPQ